VLPKVILWGPPGTAAAVQQRPHIMLLLYTSLTPPLKGLHGAHPALQCSFQCKPCWQRLAGGQACRMVQGEEAAPQEQ